MHWEKSPPSALARPKPYQGVRVRDPVKELLRRKRSLGTAPPPVEAVSQNNHIQLSHTHGIFGSDVASGPPTDQSNSDAVLQCAGWKAAPSCSGGLQPATTPWSSSDYIQQDRSAHNAATPAITADVYMQTLCPSYTMLTYTHTPLLTNFGTIPVAPSPASLPQVDLPESGLTYLPWAQPLTTISTMPSPGVQFSTNPAALPGSPLVHMPLSLTTVIPQSDTQPQMLDLQQSPNQHLDCEPQGESLDEDVGVDSESPSLLDKLLEERKAEGCEDKDSYGNSLFITNV